MTNESLLLEFGQYGEWFCDGSFRWAHDATDSKIDDVEGVEPEVTEVVVSAVDQLLARKGVNPGLVLTAARAQFGDDHEAWRIGMERLLDDLVGYVRTVEVAGVGVVHAGLNRVSQ